MSALLKLSALFAVASIAAAFPGHGHGHGYDHGVAHGHGHGHDHHDYYAEPNYKYGYGVSDKHTGDVKSATESRHGGVTQGSYSLLQPDGVTRTVKYTSDPKTGFKADVYLDGHLQKHEAPQPVVHAVHAPVVHGHYAPAAHGHGHGHHVAHVSHVAHDAHSYHH